MDLNFLIFPAPKPSYSYDHPNLIYIVNQDEKVQFTRQYASERQDQKKITQKVQINSHSNKYLHINVSQFCTHVDPEKRPIPCLWLGYHNSNFVLVYFHGNAEDLGISCSFLQSIRDVLQINILAVEYPGYGIYQGKPSSQNIFDDADIVIKYLIKQEGYLPQKIFIFGRSIGTGPATYISAKYQLGLLILMCPYLSIRAVVKNMLGLIPSLLVADRFKNIDFIEHVTQPIFIVHGMKDKLIPYQHSEELYKKCKDINKTHLQLNDQMTHNEFNLIKDFIDPLKKFIKKHHIRGGPKKIENHEQ